MHLTIRKYRKIEGDRKQIVDLVNRDFMTLLGKIDGFIDFYAFYADDDSLVSVSVFRDARGTAESIRAAADWVGKHLSKLLPEKPEVISGEVFAHRHVEKKAA